MITQVGGPDTISVTKDPRRKSQNVQFNNSTRIHYNAKALKGGMDSYNPNSLSREYRQQKSNALWTSISIGLGSVLFMAGCLIASGLKKVKPSAVI